MCAASFMPFSEEFLMNTFLCRTYNLNAPVQFLCVCIYVCQPFETLLITSAYFLQCPFSFRNYNLRMKGVAVKNTEYFFEPSLPSSSSPTLSSSSSSSYETNSRVEVNIVAVIENEWV